MGLRRIRSGRHELVIGLGWEARQPGAGESVARLRKRLLKEFGRSFGVILDSPSGVAVGWTPKVSRYERRALKGLPSAVAVAAALSPAQNGVFVERLPDGNYWLAAVQSGLPNARSDMVGSEQEIEEAVRTLLSFGSYEVFPEGTLGTLIDQADKKRIKALCVGDTSRRVPMIAAVAVVAAIVASAALLLDHQERDALKRRHVLSTASPNAGRQTMDEAKAQQREARLKYLKALAVAPLPADMLQVWYEAIRRERVTIAQWRIKAVNCSDDRCVIQYQRHQGTLAELAAAAPGADGSVSNIDEASRSVEARRTLLGEDALSRVVAYTRAGRQELISMVQSLKNRGVEMQIAEPSAEPLLPYRLGRFELRGQRFHELRSAVASLDGSSLRASTRLTSLSLSLSGGAVTGWKAEGAYVFSQ